MSANQALLALIACERSYLSALKDVLVASFLRPLEGKVAEAASVRALGASPSASKVLASVTAAMSGKEPARKKATDVMVLTAEDLTTLFSNVEVLLGLSENFVRDLEACQGGRVGAVIKGFVPFLKMYSEYVVNHEKASVRLEFLKNKDEAFAEMVREVEEDEARSQGQTLVDLLELPLNHVQTLRELVVQLRDATSGSLAEEKRWLSDAVREMDVALSQQEVAVQQARNVELIRSVEAKFIKSPGFSAPGREFVSSGVLSKQCRRTEKEMTFFLFNNMLAYATRVAAGSFKYKLNRKIPIDPAFDVEPIVDPTGKGRPTMLIRTSQKSFIVFANDDTARDAWMSSFRFSIDSQRDVFARMGESEAKVAAAALWQSDADCNACPLCENEFTILNRRHHCRACGTLTCGSCSKGRIEVPGQADKGKVRVCSQCERNITQGMSITSEAVFYEVDEIARQRQEEAHRNSNTRVEVAAVGSNGLNSGVAGNFAPSKIPMSTSASGVEFSCLRTSKHIVPGTTREFVAYYVRVRIGNAVDVTVPRRFSQFTEFDKSFRKRFTTIAYQLPKKRFWGSNTAVVVEERRVHLVAYLAGLADVRALWPEIARFLEIDEDVWREAVLQLMAESDSGSSSATASPAVSPQARNKSARAPPPRPPFRPDPTKHARRPAKQPSSARPEQAHVYTAPKPHVATRHSPARPMQAKVYTPPQPQVAETREVQPKGNVSALLARFQQQSQPEPEPAPEPEPVEEGVSGCFVVVEDYVAASESEMSIKTGQLLTVLDQTDPSGWWFARATDGSEGYIPKDYVSRSE